MPTLPFILQELETKHPMMFGAEFLDDGAQRSAFLCGDYVIKGCAPAWRHDAHNNDDDAHPCPPHLLYAIPFRPLKRIGVQPPEQHIVKRWCVQPYYRPFNRGERELWAWLEHRRLYWQPHPSVPRIRLDVHPNNMGVHLIAGTVHAFDW